MKGTVSKKKMKIISKAVTKYQRKAYKSYSIRIRKDTDQNVIDYLDSKPNVAQYIVSLIRADMNK